MNVRSLFLALREGRGDVAVPRSCLLEEFQASGHDVSDIQGVNERYVPDFSCRTSTGLCPNRTVFITPHARPDVARTAASALLSLPATPSGLHWTIATDFTPVDRLFPELRVGPYEYLQHWSFLAFARAHWEWFLFLTAMLL